MIVMTSLVSMKSTSEQGRTLNLHIFVIKSYHTFKFQPAIFAGSKFSSAGRKQHSAWQIEFQQTFWRKAFFLEDLEQNIYIFDQKESFNFNGDSLGSLYTAWSWIAIKNSALLVQQNQKIKRKTFSMNATAIVSQLTISTQFEVKTWSIFCHFFMA